MGLKPQDIRIGNLFYSTAHGYTKLKGITINKDGNGQYKFSHDERINGIVKGIQLTTENIQLLGFECEYQSISINEQYHFDNEFFINRCKENNNFFFQEGPYLVYLKEVHELQNLYFALTEKELPIDIELFNKPPYKHL